MNPPSFEKFDGGASSRWPQTLSGHAWRKRSTDDVAAEMKQGKELFPQVKEFFFDEDMGEDRRRGIRLMTSYMDEVQFRRNGTEVYMRMTGHRDP